MVATCSDHALKMMSVSTSMKTNPVEFTKQNPTSALPSHGGMKIWPRIEHGTKPSTFARDFGNLDRRWFHCQSSKVTWKKTQLPRKVSGNGIEISRVILEYPLLNQVSWKPGPNTPSLVQE